MISLTLWENSAMKSKILFIITIFIFITGFTDTFDIRKERVGNLFYGMTDVEIKKILGKPKSLSKAEFVHATGEWEQFWEYTPLGIKLGLCATNQNSPAQLCKIFITAPSKLATSRGIHIGSTAADIQKAYQKEINIEDSTEQGAKEKLIVVGSVYGGLLFTMKNNKVSQIFIGAAAE